jgi:hypothetical protein
VKVKALGYLFSLCSILAGSAALAQEAASSSGKATEVIGRHKRYCEIFLR